MNRTEISFYKSELLETHGFSVHGFTNRLGGISQAPYDTLNLAHDVGDDPACVKENLSRLKKTLGISLPLARVKQVHGNRIVDAEELVAGRNDTWEAPPEVEADGIVGKGAAGLLAVQNADCAPVLLGDPDTSIVAALHAGWRGTQRGVIRNGVRAMLHLGASPARIVAAIGPCICHDCFEVGEEVARFFPESYDPIKNRPGKFLLDLPLAVEVSLLGAGLLGNNIEKIDACPSCLSEELFSYRKAGGQTGRIMGFIGVP